MAHKALGPAGLAVFQAVRAVHADEPVLVACSGGADSLALALAVATLAERTGCPARAVVVDHGLQAGSAEHSRRVTAQLGTIGLPAEVVAVEVPVGADGPEAAARTARYSALTEALTPGERCYLGHTLDDQAETVLLGLARGSGLRSLAGMPPHRGAFVRPLLNMTRASTRAACQEHGWDWWDDPHNTDPRFARVRVRTRVLPVLEAELGPGVADALARTADLARADADALDALARGHARSEPDCAVLVELPTALRTRVLRGWLMDQGAGEVNRQHVAAVEALIIDWHGQRWVEVPGLRIIRRDSRLYAEPSPGEPTGQVS